MNTSPFNKDLATVTEELGSNLYLQQILEETPNGVMVVNLEHQVLYANPAATTFIGAVHRGLTDSHLQSALGRQNDELYSLIEEFFKHPENRDELRFRHEIQIETGDSEVQILDAVLVYPPSSPGYYLLYLIDITTRKKLEGKLRRRNAFFHNLIESSVDGIIASDMKGNLIIFNQSAQELLGYDDEEKFKLHVSGLYNEGLAKTILRRMRSDDYGGKGKLKHQELIVKNKHGVDIPVNFSGGIIYDNEQEIATFGIFTDLRAMLRIEEDLEQTQAENQLRSVIRDLQVAQSREDIRSNQRLMQWLPVLASGVSDDAVNHSLTNLIGYASRDNELRFERRRALAYPVMLLVGVGFVFALLIFVMDYSGRGVIHSMKRGMCLCVFRAEFEHS